eukprot:3126373-Rhodomonas_salina.3
MSDPSIAEQSRGRWADATSSFLSHDPQACPNSRQVGPGVVQIFSSVFQVHAFQHPPATISAQTTITALDADKGPVFAHSSSPLCGQLGHSFWDSPRPSSLL